MAFVLSGFKEVAKEIGRKLGIDYGCVFSLLVKEFRKDRKRVFDRVLQRLGYHDMGYVRELVEVYRGHKPKIRLYQDAAVVLPILRTHFFLGIITDGFPLTQKRKIQALGIKEYFDGIICTMEKGQDYVKPSSKPFIDMLWKFSLSPEEAVYVGDNLEKDFKGPNEIGMKSIRVLRRGIYRDAVAPDESYCPDFEITSLLELPGLLEVIT